MSITIPPILVLIVCKTVAGPMTDFENENAKFTGHENRPWAYENSMMTCRRHEVQLYDPAEGAQLNPNDDQVPALQPNFSQYAQCARAGIRLATEWDQVNKRGPWRVWRVGCPTPIVDSRSGQIIGFKLPDCGRRDTVVCETDSVI